MRRLHYGWIIAASCFTITFTLGEALWSYGIFFKPLQEEFGWSRAITSSGNTAFLIAYGVSCIVTGAIADRYSPRNLLIGAATLTGAGFYLASTAGDIGAFRAYMAMAGLGAGATWSVPTSVVQRWFLKRRAAILGIVVAGIGLGGMVFPPLINYSIEAYGMRQSYVLLGIIYFVIITAAALPIAHSPEKKGLKPYGAGMQAAGPLAEDERREAAPVSVGGLLRSREFMYLAIGYMGGMAGINIVFTHLVPAATDMGVSAAFAATAVSTLGTFSIPGRLVIGFIADRIGWTRALVLTNTIAAIAVLWLAFSKSPWMIQVFVVVYGFCHGARAPTAAGAIGNVFGMRSLGMLIGFISGLGHFAGAFSPYLAGYIFDHTQSYFIAFLLASGMYLAPAVLGLGLRPIKWRLPVLWRSARPDAPPR